MANILVIDDEPGIRSVLRDIFEDESYNVFDAGDGIRGLEMLESEIIHLVVLDVWLPNIGGIDVLKKIKEDYPEIEVIIISGHANIDLAVKAVKLGAFDFLEKPLSLDKILTLARNATAMNALKTENKKLKSSVISEETMIGESEPIRLIKQTINQSAGSDAKILITGDNGTGKELVARDIHRKSQRNTKPFIEVNCAAIPDTLIESELFGHEKGAFTGALSQRRGKFESADGGTLFLDEVADMSLSAQAKVLRVIQEMRFERVGSEETRKVDVRIIAATNKDIHQEIADGNFREDLYFRLNVVPIHVPPLSDRRGDIPLLIEYFIQEMHKTENITASEFSPEAIDMLIDYSWPGNVRELKNFIERVTIMSEEDVISVETASKFLGSSEEKQEKIINPLIEKFSDMKLSEARDEFERMLLLQKLEENEYNITRAAQSLGIYPSNLHGKIKKFDIEIKK
ncbi:MAG: sigma-54 dependent transcriptional regulator [Spirochaetales bacterium]|uniref:Sigma-54 dependent transcriptional regulator n=1 Tax=Candidatus Thalassospirochaeta sargassi TaxID=3119039 RepID=A0AAJ1IDA8_9SPIO|nr:sigma-54 dependent transcriptional regulator [Spirochaetales bacterium]